MQEPTQIFSALSHSSLSTSGSNTSSTTFASWCADQCGYLESGIIPKFSLCSDGVNWFKGKGQWQGKNYEPQAGDLLFFDWRNDGSIDHVGIMWRNARMERSIPWRATLGMPANSRVIQSGATLSTVTWVVRYV